MTFHFSLLSRCRNNDPPVTVTVAQPPGLPGYSCTSHTTNHSPTLKLSVLVKVGAGDQHNSWTNARYYHVAELLKEHNMAAFLLLRKPRGKLFVAHTSGQSELHTGGGGAAQSLSVT